MGAPIFAGPGLIIRRIRNRSISPNLKKKNIKILLLGGSGEEQLNQDLKKAFGDNIYDSGIDNNLREFASILKHCSAVIAGDTLAMHIAIALDVYTIAIFGPTCDQEIDIYANGKKIISDIECSPCYKSECNKKDNCMARIRLQDVIGALNA